VGGSSRMDAVVNHLQKRADIVLNEQRVDWEGLAAILKKREIRDVVADKEREMELRTTLALLQLAVDRGQSTVWATGKNLTVNMIVNGELPSTRFGSKWEAGQTVYELFKTKDKLNPAVAAHLRALAGSASSLRLNSEFANMFLKVLPLSDEAGAVSGCISILSSNGD